VLDDYLAEVSDNYVSDTVPVLVVDRLEAVEVHHEQGERLTRVVRLGQFALYLVVEVSPVVEAGQFVASGQLLQLVHLEAELRLVPVEQRHLYTAQDEVAESGVGERDNRQHDIERVFPGLIGLGEEHEEEQRERHDRHGKAAAPGDAIDARLVADEIVFCYRS
jgi:hypothetical protein